MIIGISGKKQHGKDTVARIIQFLTSPEHKDGWNNFNNWMEAVNDNPLNVEWKIKRFADKLKQTVALFIGCSVEDLENEEFKNKPLGEEWNYNSVQPEHGFGSKLIDWDRELLPRIHTARTLLQMIGTQGLRNTIHPNIHVLGLFTNYINSKPCSCEEKKKNDPRIMNIRCFHCTKKEGSKWIIPDVRFNNEVKAIKERKGLVIRVNNPRIKSEDNHQSEIELDNYDKFDWIINNDGTIEDLVIKVKDFLYTNKLI